MSDTACRTPHSAGLPIHPDTPSQILPDSAESAAVAAAIQAMRGEEFCSRVGKVRRSHQRHHARRDLGDCGLVHLRRKCSGAYAKMPPHI